jgi:4a-hydroxytetrahydrobiopterin dehydratase
MKTIPLPHLKQMEEWPKDPQGRLSKVFTFKNYRMSFAFVSQVAMLAEKKNHHPEIILDYGKVRVSLISHDVQKITERDLELATQIDKIYSS